MTTAWSRRALVFATGIALGALTLAVPRESLFAADRVEKVRKDGIAVGTYGAPPIGAHVANGRFTGLPGDTFTECAGRLGIAADKIYVTSVTWASLIPGLLSARWDIIATGMAVNPQREEIAIHTKPHRIQSPGALIRSNAPERIRTVRNVRDIKERGLRYGATTGGLELKFGKDTLGMGANAVGYDGVPNMIEDLRSGRVDVILSARYEFVQWLRATGSKEFELAPNWKPDPELVFYTAWWFRKEDTALRDAFDGCLAAMKADGAMLKVFEKYGFTKDDINWNQ